MRRLFGILLAAALAGGCSCKHGGPGGGGPGGGNGGLVGVDGDPQATPDPLDFGTVDTGSTHTLGLVISNQGSGPLTVESAVVSGDPAFSIPKVPSNSLQPASSFTISVHFQPPSDGPHQAQLTLETDSAAQPTLVVPLKGVAFSYKVEVTPSELDFGDVQVGTTSQAQTFTITNDATAAEDIVVGPIQGSSDYQFSPSGVQKGVPANGTVVVSVTLAPQNPGDEPATTLPIYPCQGCQGVPVTLTGTGVDTELVFSPSGVTFGAVPQGTTATQTVIVQAVSNPQSATSPIPATLTAAPAFAPGVSAGLTVTPVDANGNPTSWPAQLVPGGGTTSFALLQVAYAPGNSPPPSASGVVQVPYTDGTVVKTPAQLLVTAGESGSPCQQVVASPSAVNFGTVAAGTTASKPVTFTNNGPLLCTLSNLQINPNDPFNEFGLQAPGSQLSLSPGQSQGVTVTFAPAQGTPPLVRTAKFAMTTSDPTVPNMTVPLSGSLQNTVYAASAWPKWHHDNGNSGYTTADTSGNQGRVAWNVAIGKPIATATRFSSYIHSPAIGVDPSSGHDIVYMLGYNNWQPSPKPCQPGSGSGLLYAIDGPSGQQIWATPMTGPEDMAQESTPTIVADNSIFLMTGGEQSYYPQYYHIAPDGSILWSGVQAIGGATFACAFDASGATDCSNAGGQTCGQQGTTGTKINDGFDTCPGFDNNGILYLFDDDQPGCDTYTSTSGAPSLVWSGTAAQPQSGGKPAAHVESFSGALTDTSQSVFSWGGYVVSFDPKGNELWGMATGNGQMVNGWAPKGGTQKCENDSEGSPAIDGAGNEAVVPFGGYDATCSTITGGIVGVNLGVSGTGGTQDWGYQWTGQPPPPAPYDKTGYGSALVGYSSPASLGDGGWVMGWLDGIYAFDPPAGGTGPATIRWHVPAGLVLSSPAVGGDGTVFVGSTDGNFYAINGKSGAVRWKYTVGAAINSSPAIGSDGTVYFAADDGNLYGLH